LRKEWEKEIPLLLFTRRLLMKDKIKVLLDDKIKKLNIFVDDTFISTEEGKKVLNIVLDSDEIIDLNRVTNASRIINKIMDEHVELLQDCDELDIYSKEKGEVKNG